MILAGAALLLLLPGAWALEPVPIGVESALGYPHWWFERGVIQRTNPATTSPAWPADYAAQDDFAALNQGQLKALAVAAYDELQARIPSGAGPAVTTLLKTWFQTDGEGAWEYGADGERIPLPSEANYALVNQGQLKAVAQPFYDRLIALQVVTAYPWSGPPAHDSAANLGQAKALFAFMGDADENQNGLPDWWERAMGLILPIDPTNPNGSGSGGGGGGGSGSGATGPGAGGNSDGDGLTDLEEYQRGTNPAAKDSDNDGVEDSVDQYPNDPLRSEDLPVVNYAAINISAATQAAAAADGYPTEVWSAALDDENRAGFLMGHYVDSFRHDENATATARGYTWLAGTAALVSDQPPAKTVTYREEGWVRPPEVLDDPLERLYAARLVNAQGHTLGMYLDFDPRGEYYCFSGLYAKTPGLSSVPAVYVDTDPPSFMGVPVSFYGWGENDLLAGSFDPEAVYGFSGALGGCGNYGEVDTRWQPACVSLHGVTAGLVTVPVFWLSKIGYGPGDYSSLPLIFGNPCSVNDSGQIISETLIVSDRASATLTNYSDLVPAKYQKQIRWGYSATTSMFLSNVPQGATLGKILRYGQSWEGPANQGRWVNTYFLFETDSTGANVVRRVHLPENLPLDIQSINQNGVLSAIKKHDAAAMLLLPVELIDTKNRTLDDGDDVSIEPKATVLEQKEKSIAWIEPHGSEDTPGAPDMPQPALRFRGTETMGLKIKWKLAVKYDRPRGTNPNVQQIRDQDEVYIPKKAAGQQEQPWKEEALNVSIEIFNHEDWIGALQEKGFFGGEAELKYQLLKADGTVLGNEATMLFSIGGKNPEDGLAKQYIDPKARAADTRLERLSYAVAKHESKDYNGNGSRYNEFWEDYARRFRVDHRKGDPLWCLSTGESSAGGFGIYQITGNLTSQFAIIPREQFWSWRKNVDAYITIVKTGGGAAKGSVMDRFFAAVARTYPNDPEAQTPPTNFAYDGGNYDAWEMGAITLYNGAGGCPTSHLKNAAGKTVPLINPWTYETGRPSGSRWQYHRNSNNYLHEVIQER